MPFPICKLQIVNCQLSSWPHFFRKVQAMKTISLMQPWATLVVVGAKQIETRSWTTDYRGPLLIHASRSRAGAELAMAPPFTKYIPDFGTLPFGAIIGRVELQDVVRTETLGLPDGELGRLTLEEHAFGDYTSGRWAWLLAEPVVFGEPVPAKGTLGLWDFPM